MSNTVIALKSSGTASNVVNANNLVYGELAINYADGILYYKTASNTVGSIKTAQPGGLNTEIQFNDSGVFGGSSNFVYQKSNVRLGIGTSSPLGKLHIKSNAAAGAGGFSHLVVDQTLDSSQSRISLKSRFGSLSVTETEVAAIHLGTVTAGYVSGILSSDIRFDTINTGTLSERVRIKSDGNVGIGTTNPSYPLEIASPNSTSIAFQRTGVSAKKWGFDSDNDSLYIVNITDFSQRLTVTNDGKIGIGTIYPSTQLYVKTEGTSNTSVKTALTLENYPYAFDPASNGFGVGIEFRGKNPQGGSSIYGNIEGVYETRSGTHQGGALLFKTDGYIGDSTTRMIIDSVGNLGLGTTSPAAFTGFTTNRTVLQIKNSTSDSGQLILGGINALLVDYDNSTGNATIRNTYGSTSANALINIDSGTLVFRTGTSYTESVRITSAGNVGIGTTSPGSKLDVKGTLRLSGSNTGYVGITTAADAGSTTYTLPSTDGTNGHVLSTNGSGTLSWVSAAGASSYWVQTGNDIYYTTGNVGIGTSSPSNSKLHIVGDWVGGHSTVKVQGITDATTGYGFYNTDGSRLGYLAYTSAGFEWYNNINVPIIFHTNTAERMRITGAGNVGVGTSSPTDKLTVSGGSNGGVRVNGSDNVYLKISGAAVNEKHIDFYHDNTLAFENFLDGSNNFIWRTRVGGLTERMRITSDGNVGIGTTSPGSKLSVTGTNSGSVPLVDLVASGTGTFQRGVRLLNSGMNNGDQIMYGVGTADSAYNMGQFYFYKAGTGSTSNRISMGLHSVDDVFNILGTGNVGIGTTSPGAILHVNASGGGTIRASRSSVSDEYIQMDHDGTNGSLRVSGAYSLIFHTNSIERARITSDGNVGIGTASPFGTTSNRTCFSVNGTNDVSLNVGSGGVQRAYLYGSASVGQVGTIGGLPLVFAPNDTERVRITSDGNVGIGTSSPLAKLDVAGEARFVSGVTTQPAITITQGFINGDISSANFTIGNFGDNSSEMRVATRGFTTFFTGATNNNTGTERMRLDSSGNLGLGEANPAAYGGFVSKYAGIGLHANSTSGAAGLNLYENAIGRFSLRTLNGSAGLSFYDTFNATERVRITSDGNVGIGTTSPDNNSGYTALTISSSTGGQTYWKSTNSSVTAYAGADHTGAYLAALTNHALIFRTNNTERMRITSAGDVGIGTTSPTGKFEVVGTTGAQFIGTFRTGDATADNNVGGGFYGNSSATATSREAILWLDADAANLSGGDYFWIKKKGFSGDVDIIQQSNSAMTFATYGAERMRLDASGRLLVGLTTDTAAGGYFGIIQAQGSFPAIVLKGTEASAKIWQIGENAGALTFYNTTDGERARITSDGNVGIGTNSPSGNLDVYSVGDSSGTSALLLRAGNSSNNFNSNQIRLSFSGGTSYSHVIKTRHHSDDYVNAIDFYVWKYGTDTASTIGTQHVMTLIQGGASSSGAGRVGIGTTSPGQKLSIVEAANYDPPATTGTNGGHFAVLKNDGPAAGSYGFLMGVSNNGNVWQQVQRVDGTQSVYNLLLQPSGGNVGIGSSTPQYRLDVNSGLNSNGFSASFGSTYAAGVWSGIHFGYLETGNTYYRKSALVFERQDGAARGKIHILNNGTNDGASATLADSRFTILYDGKVGIATTSPSETLHVSGTIRVDGTTNGIRIFQNGSNSTNSHLYLANAANDRAYNWQLNSTGSGLDFWAYDGSAWMRHHTFLANGDVGIGNTSPAVKLHINGNVRTNGIVDVNPVGGAFRFYDGTTFYGGLGMGGWAGIGASTDIVMYLQGVNYYITNQTTTLVKVQTDGNVGIGTASPNVRLHVYKSADTAVRVQTGGGTVSYIQLDDGSSNGYLIKNVSSGTGNGALAGALYTYTDNNKAFQHIHAGTPLFTILSTGNVGINSTTPSEKLEVSGNILVFGSASASAGAGTNIWLGPTSDSRDMGVRRAGSAVMAFDRYNGGWYENARFHASGNFSVGGTSDNGYKMEVNGSFAATTKSFVIDHPTKEGMKLRYGSLEGPENGVYIRGRLKNNNTIELPEYWTKLVDPDTITVQLTPIGKHQELYVEDILNNIVIIAGSENINCFYMILAERIDVEKLTVEYKEEN